MRVLKLFGLITGFISNINLNELFSKIDYKLFLGVYLGNNESFYGIICIFINLYIKIFTGVNIYNLEESLKIFGIL